MNHTLLLSADQADWLLALMRHFQFEFGGSEEPMNEGVQGRLAVIAKQPASKSQLRKGQTPKKELVIYSGELESFYGQLAMESIGARGIPLEEEIEIIQNIEKMFETDGLTIPREPSISRGLILELENEKAIKAKKPKR